jgi:menaquinone-dependent protoporphyrinogen IX oxidase
MNIVIVYDSNTGTTAKAAQVMGQIMEQAGHQCQIHSLSAADPAQILQTDMLCVGSWVKGLFIIRQHPTEGVMRFINRLENLEGKPTVVFCTYKVAAGSTLRQMAQALEGKGAKITGQFKYRGSEPDGRFVSFASSLT